MPFLLGDDLDLDGFRGLNFADPTMPTEAATKRYVDSIAANISWRNAVRVATRTNTNLASPPAAIDTITLANGDTVLLMGQSDPAENGPYTFTTGTLVRLGNVKPGWVIGVKEGATNADQFFAMGADDPFTLGVSAQSWTTFNAGAVPSYTPGNGIDVSNFQIAAKPATNGGIAVTSGGIGVVADPNGGIDVGASGVHARLDTDGALAAGVDGLAVVAAPDAGIEVSAAGLAVKVNADNGLTIDADGIAAVAGDGIGIDADGISVTATPAGGITADPTGVAVKPKANAGITVDADGVAAKLKTDGGIKAGADGLALDLYTGGQNSLRVEPGAGLLLKLDPFVSGLGHGPDGLAIRPDPAGGIQVGTFGLEAKIKNQGGLQVDANGLAAKLKSANSGLDTSQGLAVLPKPSGGIVIDAAGISVDPAVTSPRYEATIGNGTDTVFTLPHGLATYDVDVTVYTTAAPREDVHPTVRRPDTGHVELSFGRAPTSGQYRVLVRR